MLVQQGQERAGAEQRAAPLVALVGLTPEQAGVAESRGKVRCYPRGRLDDLDRAVRRGEIQQVVFANPAGLLQEMWEQEIAVDEWLRRAVHIRFIEDPCGGAQEWVELVARTWADWRRGYRRRKALAGAALTLLVVVALLLVNLAVALR